MSPSVIKHNNTNEEPECHPQADNISPEAMAQKITDIARYMIKQNNVLHDPTAVSFQTLGYGQNAATTAADLDSAAVVSKLITQLSCNLTAMRSPPALRQSVETRVEVSEELKNTVIEAQQQYKSQQQTNVDFHYTGEEELVQKHLLEMQQRNCNTIDKMHNQFVIQQQILQRSFTDLQGQYRNLHRCSFEQLLREYIEKHKLLEESFLTDQSMNFQQFCLQCKQEHKRCKRLSDQQIEFQNVDEHQKLESLCNKQMGQDDNSLDVISVDRCIQQTCDLSASTNIKKCRPWNVLGDDGISEGLYADSDDDDGWCATTDETADEAAHFRDVCIAFKNYAVEAMPEVARIERYLRLLSDGDKALMKISIDNQISNIKRAVIRNQNFLNCLILPNFLEQSESQSTTAIESNIPPDVPKTNDTVIVPNEISDTCLDAVTTFKIAASRERVDAKSIGMLSVPLPRTVDLIRRNEPSHIVTEMISEKTDILTAATKTDILTAATKTDILTTATKTDILTTAAKTDILTAATKTDILTAATKTDILTAATKTDILTAATKTDILTAATKTDILTAATKTDILTTAAKTDVLTAATKTDVLTTATKTDVLTTATKTDEIQPQQNQFPSHLTAAAKSDVLQQLDALCLDGSDLGIISNGADNDTIDSTWENLTTRMRLTSNDTISRNVGKVRSTIRQFVRDWSTEGAAERDAAYGPMLKDLKDTFSIEEHLKEYGRRPRVVCPGSGLGRLPLEIVKLGYSCQGNEFSYFMLLGSNLILNTELEVNSFAINPYCLTTSNRRGAVDHLRTVTIPDVIASQYVNAAGTDKLEFSMCAGEFVEAYNDQEKEWDAVLTCFFIDTAKHIFSYIRTIARILRPNGLWSNLGPLLFHYADISNEFSIELSWEEIKTVIEIYFTIEAEDWVSCNYTTNRLSMMQVVYNCIHFRAIRNNVPVKNES